MPDPPPEPIIRAVLKARMKEANAAAPAGIERVKASAVNAAVVAAARDGESRCSGSPVSCHRTPLGAVPVVAQARLASSRTRKTHFGRRDPKHDMCGGRRVP